MSSEEKPATDFEATYAKLLERHPTPSVDRQPPLDPADTTAIQLEEEQVMSAIRTFPAGSAGGPDGIRPQHFLDLVTCQVNGPALLTAIKTFVNALLDGRCHPADSNPGLDSGNLFSGRHSPLAQGRL